MRQGTDLTLAVAGLSKLALACCLCWTMNAAAQDRSKHVEQGELLYSTFCGACHTGTIHWREQKLATDCPSLIVQVRRWQANVGLDWSDADITDVARYLSATYYDFPDSEQKDISRSNQHKQSLCKY